MGSEMCIRDRSTVAVRRMIIESPCDALSQYLVMVSLVVTSPMLPKNRIVVASAGITLSELAETSGLGGLTFSSPKSVFGLTFVVFHHSLNSVFGLTYVVVLTGFSRSGRSMKSLPDAIFVGV